MILQIINIFALVLIPFISVGFSQWLQNRAKKREDKLFVFKTLMTSRLYGWTIDSIHALNMIDMVFNDNLKVINQWKVYRDKCFVENPDSTELKKMQWERTKLLETMAEDLKYKIDSDIIRNPYIPNGLQKLLDNQQMFQYLQLELMKKINETFPADRENK